MDEQVSKVLFSLLLGPPNILDDYYLFTRNFHPKKRLANKDIYF